MLVTFKTKAYPNITMFGDVASKLLGLMGHSASVPGSIPADGIAVALSRLRAGLAVAEQDIDVGQTDAQEDQSDSQAQKITLQQRAWPLIELLEAAAKSDEYVIWEE